MYVVKYKNMVVLTSLRWNNLYIQDVFKVRYNINLELPYNEPPPEFFPFQINDDITIYLAEEQREFISNTLVQGYVGPRWEYTDTKVIAHYDIVDYTLDVAKTNYRSVAANLRYEKEISGIEVFIQNITFKIETTRQEKLKYINQLLLMNDSDSVNWKFTDNIWLTITKSDIQSILTSINNHVQLAFNYELDLNNQINAANSFSDLEAIQDLNKKEIY